MKTKRLLSVLILSCLLPIFVLADVWQDPETKVNYEYTVGESEASVSAGKNLSAGSPDASGNISILSNFTVGDNEYTVTSIGSGAFRDCSSLISVTIPEGVTNIGELAFDDCSSLISVTIPEGVTNIDRQAFSGCTGLTSITIPSSLIGIDKSAFIGSGLTSIIVGDGNIMYDSRNNCNAIIETASNTLLIGCMNSTIPSSVTAIGDNAFDDCTGLTSVTIPSSVTSIGIYAFRGCTGLTSIVIPEGVTDIKSGTFYDCTALSSVTIPEGVTTIGFAASESPAFYNCISLTSITVPSTVKEIIPNSFYGCTALTDITILSNSPRIFESFTYTGWYINHADGLLYLDKWLIGYKGEKPMGDLVIDEGTKGIANYAFQNCKGITSITIPPSMAIIGYQSFSGCSGLIAIHISDLATWCGIDYYEATYSISNPLYNANHLFLNGEELTELTIPKSVTTIENSAFAGCNALTRITIHSRVTSIENKAFLKCSGIESVITYIQEPFEIDKTVFYRSIFGGFTSATLYVPKGTKEKYEATEGWNNFENIIEMDIQLNGDVNGDLTVDVADIASVINVMVKGDNYTIADVNGDGVVDVADIATIIDEMAARARRQE